MNRNKPTGPQSLFGQELIASLKEAVRHAKGAPSNAREHRVEKQPHDSGERKSSDI